MSHLPRNDTGLYYEVTGSGPPILFTHGFAGTSRIWRHQANALATSNEIIRWDMRGHGQTKSPAKPDAYSVDETVDDMAALLDHLGHDRAIIAGHSLGGYMALAFLLKYPERVDALLVVATGPGYKSDAPRDEWNMMANGLAQRLEKNGLTELLALDREMDLADHASAPKLAMAARGLLVQRDSGIIDSLPSIQIPTLIVVGEKDRGYVSPSRYMAKKIPNARLVTIPNAGHAVNVHQTDDFNTAAREFLGQIKRRDQEAGNANPREEE